MSAEIKRQPASDSTEKVADNGVESYVDTESLPSETTLKRTMKNRHIAMIRLVVVDIIPDW